MKIIFQNQHFVAVDKCSGWLSTPSRLGQDDSRPVLGLELQSKLQRQVFPVHRLDFEVSGLIIFALTAQAHSVANGLFEKRQISKVYQAQTENKNDDSQPLPGAEFEWKARVLRGKKRSYESPHGKDSLTVAKYLGLREQLLSWELHPLTGRAHQLRFDLARHGFPICGDVLYGAQPGPDPERIALRAVKIQFLDDHFVSVFGLPPSLQVAALF